MPGKVDSLRDLGVTYVPTKAISTSPSPTPTPTPTPPPENVLTKHEKLGDWIEKPLDLELQELATLRFQTHSHSAKPRRTKSYDERFDDLVGELVQMEELLQTV